MLFRSIRRGERGDDFRSATGERGLGFAWHGGRSVGVRSAGLKVESGLRTSGKFLVRIARQGLQRGAGMPNIENGFAMFPAILREVC